MSAGIYNTTLDQGATFQRSFQVFKSNGQTLDLTGYSFAAQLRNLPKDTGTPIAVFTCVQNSDPTLKHQVDISLTSTQTLPTNIPVAPVANNPTATQRYYYDLNITSPGGTVTRLVMGYIDVSPEVTK